MTDTERRSARLLFGSEAGGDAPGDGAPAHPRVLEAVADRRVPARPTRSFQRLAMRRGRLDWVSGSARQMAAAREAVLGAGAAGPPRVLVRVDEFPHARAWDDPERYGTERFERFHEVLAGAGVPYLLAVLPRVPRDYLDPEGTGSRPLADDEHALLGRLAGEGVTFAAHGLDHRTRHSRPRRHSELSGLGRDATAELLDSSRDELAAAGLAPRVFVPPFNRFDAGQYELLAERFDVVCGGPETVMSLGFQRTPLWRGAAVYAPSYAPLYGPAETVAPALEELRRREWALWAPLTLHWGWEYERGGLEPLERLAAQLAPLAVSWDDFLRAAAESAAAP